MKHKQQVVFLHGGDCYNSYAEFIKDFELEKASKEDFLFSPVPPKRWRFSMQKALGPGYEVFTPRMPNSENAKYREWKIWFEKILQFIEPGAIFVGHSLGGIFLVKYFTEKGDFNNTRGIFLIAAPFNANSSKDQIADFVLPKNLSKLKALGSRVYIYHSIDDDVVRFSSFKKYTKCLPGAQVRIFKDRGHFLLEEFPELVKDIRSI